MNNSLARTRTVTGIVGERGKVLHILEITTNNQGEVTSTKAKCGANNGLARRLPVYLRSDASGSICQRCYRAIESAKARR